MSNILLCGSYIPYEISYKIKNNSEAANNFQKELINNFNDRHQIHILSYISYFVENLDELKKSLDDNKVFYVIKTKNYIKNYFIYYKLLLGILINKDIDMVILYNLTYINFLVNIVCKIRGIKTTLILADYTDVCESEGLIRKIISFITKTQFKYFSYRVILSLDLMKKIDDCKSLLMQGGINKLKYIDFKPLANNGYINILYSGALEKVTGVDLLLESMHSIPQSNINLIISGRGSLSKVIKEKSKLDCRIKYVGFLEESEFLNLLQKSHILINPRNMNMDQNMNNFPSKILEYLATGRPIISTKFSGYEDFQNNIEFIDTHPQKLAEAIQNQIEIYDEKYQEVFIKNRSFSLQYSWDQQIEKIERFIFN